MHFDTPLNICNIFQIHNSSYNLRQSDFSVPKYNTVAWQTFNALFMTHIMEQTDNCRQISSIVLIATAVLKTVYSVQA